MSESSPKPSDVLPPEEAQKKDGPDAQRPPICTPEQEANGTCVPPVRNPETPAES